MTKFNWVSNTKRYIAILFFIVFFSFAYTFMIAFLFAEDYKTINYSLISGISSSIIGCIALFIVYKVDSILNKVIISTSKSTILIKFFISFLSTSLLFFFISWMLNIILKNDFSVSFSFLKEQITIINYLLILILAYHTIAYFTRAISKKNKALKAENLQMNLALHKYLKRIPSVLNKKTSLISIDDIFYFKIEDGILFAYVSSESKKKPLLITTLNDLESKINPALFFRINRAEIVHIDKIISFEPYFKDRLAIKLTDNKTILYTSNNRSAAFRKWLINPTDY